MTETQTRELHGDTAFGALRDVLAGTRDADSFRCEDVPFERLRRGATDRDLTVRERIVRLRHALRYADTALRGAGATRSLPLFAEARALDREGLREFGLHLHGRGEARALPWRPDWLDDVPESGVDYSAVLGHARTWSDKPPEADPWVRAHLGITHYRGPGQALAVRAALNMPAGTSLAIVLPTGEGKSLVFEALAQARADATVAVVVPTIALALDMEQRLRRPDVAGHLAYVGGAENVERSTAIAGALRSGEQRLVFASPEAFVSSLREPLLARAKAGMLAAVVIDEAHLVQAWGTDFRGAYQKIAALVAELRAVAPTGDAPRVICLSATLSQIAFDTLEALFSAGESLALVSGARLRPELDLWIAKRVAENVRSARVLEAIAQLPRPAIVYVTRVDAADAWRARLAAAGYRRVGVVHGGTSADDRARVLERWRSGDLDLVVGTAAFGLGIDLAHVRAVVHACVPESLDRYYQEIGRAGRDNRAATALIVPSHDDFPTAKSLSRTTVITEAKGRARWATMFHAAVERDGDPRRVLIDVATSPRYNRDMVSGLNEEWNINVLNLMARAGIIRYVGWRRREVDGSMALAVDILDERHLDESFWVERVGALRKRTRDAGLRGYDAVGALLRDDACPSAAFAAMYALRASDQDFGVTLACGGCRACRATDRSWFTAWRLPPVAPRPIGVLQRPLLDFVRDGRLHVEYPNDAVGQRRFGRRCGEFVEALWRQGLRKFIVVGAAPPPVHDALAKRPWSVAVSERSALLESNGLPPGPEAVWIGAGKEIPLSHLATRPPGRERVLIAREGIDDPRHPGEPLTDRDPSFEFERLLQRLER